MAEDLTDYLQQVGVRVRYMHSDIDAIERMEIVRGLRLGDFDVLVGINLLREGLDMPEVSLVAILDADQEGFLRSDRSLIQTVGRAARHISGRAIFYADRITGSMQRAIEETARRRALQQAHNAEHGITARSVVKSVDEVRFITRVADARVEREERAAGRREPASAVADREALIAELEREMQAAAAELDFETAARLRDQLFEIRAVGDTRGAGRDGRGSDGGRSGEGRARRRAAAGTPTSGGPVGRARGPGAA
jgi:excinuclease ABC subunit B